MKAVIISGSHRPNSQSVRVAKYISNVLKMQENIHCDIRDLGAEPLPMWDPDVWKGTDLWKKAFGGLATQLEQADAFVIVAPEWGGMAPPALKNFFLLANAQMLGHKPALLVGVSSSRSGNYPISELRASSYKNNRICYIPEQLVIRDVESLLEGEQSHSEDDSYMRKRISYATGLLADYAIALRKVREAGRIDHENFPNGM